MNKRLNPIGFSLMEMIVVLALVSLLAGLVAVNYDAIISSFTQPSLEKSFFKAVRQARYQASVTKNHTILRFSDETYEFVILNENNEILEKVPSSFDPDEDTVTVSFLALSPSLEDHSHWKWEKTEIALTSLNFTPYNVSTPCLVSLLSPYDDTQVAVDPFSSFPLQEAFTPSDK